MQFEDVKQYFSGIPLVYLANCDEGNPKVRAVSLIFYEDKFWFCSGKTRPKYEQLKKNNNVEFCLLRHENDEFHNFRVTGKAIEILEPITRKNLSEVIPFFKGYWKNAEDSDFLLYLIDADSVEYHAPGGKKYYKMDLKAGNVQEFDKAFRKA